MAKKTPAATPDAGDEGKVKGKQPKKSKKKIVILVVLLVVVGGAYKFVLAPGGKATGKPEPGAVVALDPLTVNLRDGHYLRVGLALQVVKGKALSTDAAAAEADPAVEGAKALDQAIAVFGDGTMASLVGSGRVRAKQALLHRLEKAYDGAVMNVYFTEFVMQ